MAIKDEHLALSSGIGLAGLSINYLFECGQEAFNTFKEEIIESIVKPSKISSLHYYLHFFQDIEEDIHNIKGNIDELEYLFEFLERTLKENGIKPDIPYPGIYECSDKYHENCECKYEVEEWESFIKENYKEINDTIVHSAFQILYRDKRFLFDFHMELSKFIGKNIEHIKCLYPENITNKDRIKRTRFPSWLINAVTYRDMGTCSNPECRCDLSNMIRTQNVRHIDHIIPLKEFGSNDSSNFQLLCESCNTSKGAKIIETNLVTVPFWNLDKEFFKS